MSSIVRTAALTAFVLGCAIAPGAGADDRVEVGELGDETRCAIARPPDCDISLARQRGLIETGLVPRFPGGLICRMVDERFAISYTEKRGREQYHGGIDMPAPFGTPMLAVADGTVVGVYQGTNSYRGKEVILRHSLEQTGLPYWIYTQYAHFDAMPDFKVGDQVRMGQNLGPTGNSGRGRKAGIQSRKRRPAIHFGIFYSKDPRYAALRGTVVPVDGQWMDPNALYRKSAVVESRALRDLPPEDKVVDIPVMLEDGTTVPADARMIWPYSCRVP